MPGKIEELVSHLTDKEVMKGCRALKQLKEASKESDEVYPFMEDFVKLLESGNSYVRTRGLLLIADNARWDRENKIDEIIDEYLKHITDEKPITARQCIQALPEIIKYKPQLVEDIKRALLKADTNKYADSMQPLVQKDIAQVLRSMAAN